MSSPSVRVTVVLFVSILLLASQPSIGQETPDPVSADSKGWSPGDCVAGATLGATLLVPYFEVDLSTGSLTTLVAVGNAWSNHGLCRVVFWTDWGVASLAFDIYLNPHGFVTFNVRDVFLNGYLPSTGEGVDDLTRVFPHCSWLPPYHVNPIISNQDRARLAAMHTGQMDEFTKKCAGENHGDNVARGYITIDNVDECSGLEILEPIFTPANTQYPYFAEGGDRSGIAMTSNQLWGDVFYVDDANNYAQASEVVTVWADPDSFTSTDVYTFYGRYSNWDGRDERVPLPSIWDMRFLDGGPFAGGGSFMIWRDTRSPSIKPFACETGPSWRPLLSNVKVREEDGTYVDQVYATDIIPLATQRLPVSSLGYPVSFGWIEFDARINGAWVQTSLAAFGRFSASYNGTPLAFLCDAAPSTYPY
jgi:hypothetical protein